MDYEKEKIQSKKSDILPEWRDKISKQKKIPISSLLSFVLFKIACPNFTELLYKIDYSARRFALSRQKYE